MAAILIFKCTEGVGVGDYSSRGKGARNFSHFLPNRPRPLSRFDAHARWQPIILKALDLDNVTEK